MFYETTNLIIRGISSCQRSVFKDITCSERVSLFSRCTSWELVFPWQKNNRYRIRLCPVPCTPCASRTEWNVISIIFSCERSESLFARFSDATVFHWQHLQSFLSSFFIVFSNLAVFKRTDWAWDRSYNRPIRHTSSTVVLVQNFYWNFEISL